MVSAREIFGLEKNFSDEELRAAYRKTAKLLHPDLTGRDSSREFFEIRKAYRILSNARLRGLLEDRPLFPDGFSRLHQRFGGNEHSYSRFDRYGKSKHPLKGLMLSQIA